MKILLHLLLLFPLFCVGQTITWNKTFDLDLQDYGYGIVQTYDGGYVLTGYSGDYYWPNLLVMKLNSYGDTIWSKIFADEGHSHGFSICQTNDSGYVVSGFTCDNEYYWDYVMYVLKLNENGDTIWTKKYGNSNIIANRVIQTLDGNYTVLGVNYAFAFTQVVILKINDNGEEVWGKTYNFSTSTHPQIIYSLEQSLDSSYILAGYTSPQPGFEDIWIVKLDKYGDTLWTKTYGSPSLHEIGYYALPTQNGGYVVNAMSGNNMIFMKLDNNGNVLWEKSYEGALAYVIRHTADNGFIAAGYYNGMYIVKLNHQGDTLWTKVYNQNETSHARDIRQTDDLGYIVCGASVYNSWLYRDIWVLKLDESGFVKVSENKDNSDKIDLRNYPNPFQDYTIIEFESPANSPEVKLSIRNSVGIKIKEISITNINQGKNSIRFDSAELPAGIYYCLMETPAKTKTIKMIKIY